MKEEHSFFEEPTLKSQGKRLIFKVYNISSVDCVLLPCALSLTLTGSRKFLQFHSHETSSYLILQYNRPEAFPSSRCSVIITS